MYNQKRPILKMRRVSAPGTYRVIFFALFTSLFFSGVALAENGFLTGKILTTAGKPLSGGTVRLFDGTTGPSPFTVNYWRMQDYAFPIAQDGSFSGSLPEGTYYLMAVKKISGGKTDVMPETGDLLYPPLTGAHKEIRVESGQTTELGEMAQAIPFDRPQSTKGMTSISGSVLDADGKPVAEVLVMASETEAMKRPFFLADTRTDAKGNYRIGVPQGGRYYLRVKGQREIVVSAKAVSGKLAKGIDLRPTVTPIAVTAGQKSAGVCPSQDFETRVAGESGCLTMRKYGFSGSAPQTMVVWLHGDLSQGGAANYHFAAAEQVAAEFPDDRLMSVALVRPGYPDGNGQYSSGNCYSRLDTYTATNLAEVAAAIEGLRRQYQPEKVIVVGDSGGAAMAAVLLGMKPDLIQGAVLVSCPCELVNWRAGGTPWTLSENPIRWAGKVSKTAQIIALTGADDLNTPPELAERYIEALRSAGVNANFQLVEQASHGGLLNSKAVTVAIARLLH